MRETEVRVGIVGATGYSGRELIRILSRHERVSLTYLARSPEGLKNRVETRSAGSEPRFHRLPVLPYEADACVSQCDVVFVALPSGSSGQIAAELWARGLVVIDLSGDLRLPTDKYEVWYGKPPAPKEAQETAVYGLTEFNRPLIRAARLIANPGCYATCATLALYPLIQGGLYAPNTTIVVDAKSGVSGAGRTPTQNTHFPELAGNFYAYRVGRHQHTPEIEQSLRLSDGSIILTTQLLPVARGIYVTAYVKVEKTCSIDEIDACFHRVYDSEPFIRLLPPGEIPELKHVLGTNLCTIGFHLHPNQGVLQVFSVIDNLMKGAAGQAVQNLNVIQGWPETTGLEQEWPFYP
jgi:N-acetyl-gamma-glutamyl-phosphate reductase